MYPEIRREMKNQKVRMSDVASFLGISTPALSQKLAGKVPIKLFECYQILEFLRLPLDKIWFEFPAKRREDIA